MAITNETEAGTGAAEGAETLHFTPVPTKEDQSREVGNFWEMVRQGQQLPPISHEVQEGIRKPYLWEASFLQTNRSSLLNSITLFVPMVCVYPWFLDKSQEDTPPIPLNTTFDYISLYPETELISPKIA